MNTMIVLLLVANGLFALAFLGFLAGWFRSSGFPRVANYFLDLGFMLLCAVLFLEAVDLGVYIPIANAHQALVFFSWSVLLMFIFTGRGHGENGFGLVLSPLIILLLSWAIAKYSREVMITEEYFTNPFFVVHTLTAFFGYAAFALSFVASTLYLLEDRALKKKWSSRFYRQLPSLEELERMVYATVFLGIPLLTVTLVTGFIWSKERFGYYWSWDYKVMLTTATWFLYLFILYIRFVRSYRGLRVMLHTFISFFAVLLTFLGTHMFMVRPVLKSF